VTPLASTLPRDNPCLGEELSATGCPITRTTRTLDAAGRIATERFDVLDPQQIEPTFVPVVSFVVAFERDDAGRIVAERRDDHQDGTVDRLTRRTFDADGTLRRVEQVELEAGTPTHTTVHEYDAAGRETLVFHSAGRFSDTVRTVYDPAGRETARDEFENDRLAARTTWTRRSDGEPEARVRVDGNGRALDETRWRYGQEGRLEAREARDLPDGVGGFQRLLVTRYDAAGRTLRTSEDHPNDGVEDAAEETTFDPAGRRVRARTFQRGTQTSESLWAYTPDGRLLTEDTVAPARGVEVRVRYSPDGSAVSTTRRPVAGGVFVLVRHLDAAGRMRVEEIDRDGDGVPDARWSQSFDAEGRPTRVESDLDADGSPETRNTWRYDAVGNLLTMSVEENGAVVRTVRNDYTCFGP